MLPALEPSEILGHDCSQTGANTHTHIETDGQTDRALKPTEVLENGSS